MNAQECSPNTGVSTMSAHWMAFTNYLPPNNGDSDITFNVGANSTLNVTGVLETSNGYANPFIKAGDGLMILAPNNGEASGTINTYTSPTKITGGVLRLSQQKAIPGGIDSTGGTKNIELAGGVVEMNFDDFKRGLGTGATQVQFTGDGGFSAHGATRIVNLGGSVTPGGVTWASGSFVPNGNKLLLSSTVANATVDFQNPIDLNSAARTVDVRDGSAAVDAKLTGVLSGSGSSGLSKTGAGTLELAASVTHTHAGATTVSAGTLLVNGTLDAQTSAVTVNGTGILSGAGTINRPVTVQSGGTLSTAASVGTLTVGSLTMGAGTFKVAGSGTSFGGVVVSSGGSVSLDAANTTLDLSGIAAPTAAEIVLIGVLGSGTPTGAFKDLPEGTRVTVGGKPYIITYKGGDGNDVTLKVPPGGTVIMFR